MISSITWRVEDREYTKVKTLFTIAMQQLGKSLCCCTEKLLHNMMYIKSLENSQHYKPIRPVHLFTHLKY